MPVLWRNNAYHRDLPARAKTAVARATAEGGGMTKRPSFRYCEHRASAAARLSPFTPVLSCKLRTAPKRRFRRSNCPAAPGKGILTSIGMLPAWPLAPTAATAVSALSPQTAPRAPRLPPWEVFQRGPMPRQAAPSGSIRIPTASASVRNLDSSNSLRPRSGGTRLVPSHFPPRPQVV